MKRKLETVGLFLVLALAFVGLMWVSVWIRSITLPFWQGLFGMS